MMKKLVALLMALALLCSSIGALADVTYTDVDEPYTNLQEYKKHTDASHSTGESSLKESVAATCVHAKLVWTYCSTCAVRYWKPVGGTIATAHDPESVTKTPYSDANCQQPAQLKFECSDCKAVWYDDVEGSVIDPNNHTKPVNFTNDAATCDPNVTKYAHWRCDDCNAKWNVPLEKKAHTPGDPVVVDPTETECGTSTISCSVCSTEISSTKIAPTVFAKYGVNAELYDYTEPVDFDELEDIYDADIDIGKHTKGFLKKNTFTAPTCKAAGSVTYFCVDCHKDVTFVLPVLAHTKDMLKDPVVIPGTRVEPTCTENGEVKYKGICNTCKTEQIVTVVLEANGEHVSDGTAPVYTKPTCTEAGKLTYICKNCKKPYDVPYGTPNKHSWERDEDQAGQNYIEEATCKEDGKYSFAVVCEDCGEIKPGSEDDGKVAVIPKLNHQAALDKLVKEDKIYVVDKKTGDVSIASTFKATAESGVLKLDPVKNEDGKVIAIYADCTITYVPAKCTEAGHLTIVCDDECGAKIDVELTALGHNMTQYYDKEGNPLKGLNQIKDCTEVNSLLLYCSNEGCDYFENVDVPAKYAHEFTEPAGFSQVVPGGNTVIYETEAEVAKCEEYKEILKCKYCQKTTTKTHEATIDHVIDKQNEEYPPIIIEPTCTTAGYTSYRCALCGFYQNDTKEALGHKWVSGKTLVEATCTDTGVREIYCERCCHYESDADAEGGKKLVANDGCEIVKDTETIPTLPHNWVKHTQLPDTKTCKDGFYYEQCSMCKEKRNEVALTGHTYDKKDVVWDPKPTCTTPGLASFKCTVCHERVQVEYPKLGHSYQRDGKNEYGVDVIKDIETVIAEHEADPDKCTKDCVAAGCLTDAVHTIICDTCKEPLTWTEEETAVGHHNMYTDSTKTKLNKFQILVAPNCTREGKAQYQCSDCKAVVEYTLPKLPHNLVAKFDKEKGVYYFYCEELIKGEQADS